MKSKIIGAFQVVGTCVFHGHHVGTIRRSGVTFYDAHFFETREEAETRKTELLRDGWMVNGLHGTFDHLSVRQIRDGDAISQYEMIVATPNRPFCEVLALDECDSLPVSF